MDASVRDVERWGLVAGVTGVTGNALLVTLFAVALPGNPEFDWTGPANDVIGAVSAGATIPVAFALRDIVGGGVLVRRMTTLAVVGMGTVVVLSGLLVVDVIPFEVQAAGAVPSILLWFSWLAVVGREGLRTGALPRRLARWATFMGISMPLGAALVASSFALPEGSVGRLVLGGAGILVGFPAFLGFPVWLIALSGRIRAHVEGASSRVEAVTA